MAELLYYLISLLFFDIPLLQHYINLRSLIICHLFSGDIYFSYSISLSNPVFSISLSTVSESFCGECFETFVILSTTVLPIKWPVASVAF